MAVNCECGTVTLGNTGASACRPVAKTTTKIIYTSTYGSDGTLNKIASGQSVDAAYVTSKLNEANVLNRWLPSYDELNAVTNVRAETTFATKEDGSKTRLFQGIKAFTAEEWSMSSVYYGEVKALSCGQMSAYLVDVDGQLRGIKHDTTGDVYPIKISKGSFDPNYLDPTASETEKVIHSFDWSKSEKDEDLRVITSAADVDLTDIKGLAPIESVNSAITTAGFTVALTSIYGAVLSGLVLGDFAANELTPNPGAVAITSAVETGTTGVYTIVFTTPATAADTIELVVTKEGFEFSAVQANIVTIP